MIENKGKFKEQWHNYFEGGIEMWSFFGYQYHSYLIIKHIVSKLDLPKDGYIVQIGTGLGIAIENLCTNFDARRVIGYDLFNPLGHPNIQFLDTDVSIPPIRQMAFLDIDVGSMSHARANRKSLLLWAIDEMLPGGYILTNKPLALELKEMRYNFDIIELNTFDVPELWNNPHQSRLNTKVLLKIKKKI